MWLLDVNMPKKVVGLLAEFGIEARTAEACGWEALTNGALVEAAVQAEFSCVLTRDRLFSESAARALKKFPQFGVVFITIPQMRWSEFVETFKDAWRRSPIAPIPGQALRWPST